MEIYRVGPDDAGIGQDERFEWIVEDYRYESWEGMGEAVGLCKEDGLLYIANLGHCSCYGPMENEDMKSGEKMTVADFLKDKDDIMAYDAGTTIKGKVRELVKWEGPVFSDNFSFLKP